MKIDNDVKMPRERVSKAKQRINKAFKAYCDAYQRIYTLRPSHYVINDQGHIAAVVKGRQNPGMSYRRMQQLTKNMNAMNVNTKANTDAP